MIWCIRIGPLSGLMIYLDTHVAVWLYAGDLTRFSPVALELLRSEDLIISPMVELELEYLREIERITVQSSLIIESLSQTVGLQVCDLPFAQVVTESILHNWTRDPFDRIIVAQACARQARLLTKDRNIQQHYSQAVW